MAKKPKLPLIYEKASPSNLATKIKITSGNNSQVVSQVEFRAFKAIADALEIPLVERG